MGSWNKLHNQPGFNADTMLLLTDGTVMCHESGSANWHRLQPDASGTYSNGNWSSLASLPSNSVITAGQNGPTNAPTYFASAVLRDGRVFTSGGEDNNGANSADISATQIYDPVADAWTIITPPPDLPQIGDAISCVLGDGRLIIGTSSSGSNAVDILDPNTLIYEPTGPKGDSPSEESWTLLPNGNVLAVQCSNSPNAEQYNPTTNQWIAAGSTPSALPQPCPGNVPEIGPALLLPDGRVFAIGATGATALYTQNTDPTVAGTWVAGPNITDGKGNTLYPMDAPGVLLPNGKVLLTASPAPPCSYPGPTTFLEYDPSTNEATPIASPGNSSLACYDGRMLLLPDGTVLFANQSNDIEYYTPDPGGQSSWAPAITNCPTTMVIGRIYTISGTQFNGLSQACSYGDDAQMATNYPIVRLTNTSGQVAYLRTSNFSTMAVATGTQLVSTDVTVTGPYVSAGDWTLEVIANGIASAGVAVTIAAQGCLVLTQNSTFNAGQITAIIETSSAPAIIQEAAYVVVEGFTQNQIGGNKPAIPNPVPKISYTEMGPPVPTDPSLPPTAIQTFTFAFTAVFTDASMFGSTDQTLTLTATFTSTDGITVQAQGQIELLATPNPYLLHGDTGNTWYLSVDIGVFQVTAGQTAFGATMSSAGGTNFTTIQSNAQQFIHTVIGNLNASGSTVTSQFAATASDQDDAVVNLLNADNGGNPIYNFALARVRYQDVNPAMNVRVFFRMWQAQQTNATYDTSTYYRSYQSGTEKIPLLGIEGDEIVTIPFFAATRVDSTTASMTTQIDPDNVQPTIQPGAGGALVEVYYGCWLDVNQPNSTPFPPWMAGVSPLDGPYDGGEPLVSILQLVRATHQCLIAEIAYDPDVIPSNSDPSTSDQLAQRNLTFINIPNPGIEASRIAPQALEIKPSGAVLLPDKRPDELMISWGNTPHGSTAQLYLPAVSAAKVLASADKLYPAHALTQIDPHTIGCTASGITYIPIPQSSSGLNYMGLMSLALPATVHKGDFYGVTVRQLTSAAGRRGGNFNESSFSVDDDVFFWRRVAGIFHLTIPVGTKTELLEPEERTLAVMRFIAKSIPLQSRWYPVFLRYIEQQVGRVAGLGGDPATIGASAGGLLPRPGPGKRHPGGGVKECEFRGKIAGIRYDHFGDFEGFLLEVGCREVMCFNSREVKVERIVQRALTERWTLTILADAHDPCCAVSITISGVPYICC